MNLHLGQGEVLGLLGDNGAGKSTLIKIICGFQPPTSGRIVLEGKEITLKSVDDARSLGIDTVFQDLALINELTVYHNMFLNRERTRWTLLSNRSMRRTAQEELDRIGVNIPSVDAEVAKLSGGQRQAIAVARAVTSNAKVLLLDEPLAAMGAKEGAMILELVKDLKSQGQVSIIMIMHNYGQALEVCDRINLLQHGEITFDKLAKDTSVQELNDIVIEEYRRALAERQRQVGLSSIPRPRTRAWGQAAGAGRASGKMTVMPSLRRTNRPGRMTSPRPARPGWLAVTGAVGAVLLAVAGCTASGGATAGSSASAAPGSATGSPGASALHWHSCSIEGASLQCARLSVPLDYAHPAGRKITLALSRVPATAPPSQQQGDLLVNPGGPGGSGLALAAFVADGLTRRWPPTTTSSASTRAGWVPAARR